MNNVPTIGGRRKEPVMNAKKIAAMGLLLAGASFPVLANHVHFGVVIGGPFWGPPAYYYPPPVYYPPVYYPPVVTVPVQPPTYVEQPSAPSDLQQPSGQVWYYCSKPKGYYPYVQKCPRGWQQVAPTPPDSNQPDQ
jgi:hypothetical protein